ncbi:MAG: SH3 domain-containing protein [Epulopiscium sp.]|nr:SH3 domain-containing protein [Candidatus Epulonipiscium sp.]
MRYQRQILKTFFITAIMTSMCVTQAMAAVSGKITTDNVNIRSAASADAAVLGQGQKDSELIILGKNGDWFQVSFDGNDNAYISQDYFKVSRAEGTVNASGVNVRQGASTASPILKSLNQGDTITVIGQNNAWYQLAYNNGQAYISKEFLSGNLLQYLPQIAEAPVEVAGAQLQNTYGIVTASGGLRVRQQASTDSAILTTLSNGEVFNVLESGAQWMKISTENSVIGYVSAEYVSIRTGEKPSRSNSSGKGEQVVAYASQFLGTPYVWGGTDLRNGVDCSGFVYAVMKNFGVSLNRSSSAMASNGVAVNKSDLVAGDLVFFDSEGNGGISHVGIYVGGGQYIHSSSGKTKGVIYSNLNDAYSARTYVTARRVLR